MPRLWLLVALLAASPPRPEYRPVEKQAHTVSRSAARLAALAQQSAKAGRPVALSPLFAEAEALAQELARLEARLAELPPPGEGAPAP